MSVQFRPPAPNKKKINKGLKAFYGFKSFSFLTSHLGFIRILSHLLAVRWVFMSRQPDSFPPVPTISIKQKIRTGFPNQPLNSRVSFALCPLF
ncbi:MAG: hypothetical protein A2Y79_10970 [Deltaproteobacteria bacterium RBG_13_43_22]|nr:MAG: hypothetical protein A2Y79_10970 [Deltaproteobacteria bacterium RBG_13_43_22]